MKNLVKAFSNQVVITSLVILHGKCKKFKGKLVYKHRDEVVSNLTWKLVKQQHTKKRKNIIFSLLGKTKKDQYFQGPCHLESSIITTHILYLSPQTAFGPLISLYPP
jgi:hypothetical protein